MHFFAGARIDEVACLKKERHVPNVVQSKRDERALHDAVDGKCERRLPVHRPMENALMALPIGGQIKLMITADDNNGKGGNDRHRALSGKEAEIGGQLD